MTPRIAVVGLGYVGLPAALAFSGTYDVIGFDIDKTKVDSLVPHGHPRLRFTDKSSDLWDRNVYIVAVPTPIDAAKRPDLRALRDASRIIGKVLSFGDIVVYESTVYPGVTEGICGPILAETSGLRCGKDFFLAYSPERINPGDKERGFADVVKVVSAQTPEALDAVAAIYGSVVSAGIHVASSIAVAEACKVIENIQRDLNIALMNELAIIFNTLGIKTQEVLDAAATKWNFVRYSPGLVGGHCIGVDPYYLTARAEEVGIRPEVILAGRRINDEMGKFVARETIKIMGRNDCHISGARVGVLGLAFKEDVGDLRNSRVFDLVRELGEFGVEAVVHDPLVDPVAANAQGIVLHPIDAVLSCETVILAVPHEGLAERATASAGGVRVFIDVKSAIARHDLPPNVQYWSL